MLELDEEERINFHELLELLGSFGKKSSMLTSYVNKASYMSTSSNNNQNNTDFKSPLSKKSSVIYKNDCSPFKGGNAFVSNRTPEKSNRTPTKQGNGRLLQK